GFVALITPEDFIPRPAPVFSELTDEQLVAALAHPADAGRLHAQREILRRPSITAAALLAAARHTTSPAYARVAALWTLRQKDWDGFRSAFATLLIDPLLREHAVRAATDRRTQLDKSLFAPIFSKLDDPDPRVQAATIVALGRCGDLRAAQGLLQAAQRTEAAPAGHADAWRNPDPGRVLQHLAVQALADLQAVDACLAAIGTPLEQHALAALQRIHQPATVDGLFRKLGSTWDPRRRSELWTALIRLYHREGEFTADSPQWWGTRPDTSGPYYDRQKWAESDRIAAAVKTALQDGNEAQKAELQAILKRHVVNLEGVSDQAAAMVADKPIELPKADPGDPNLIANLPWEQVLARTIAAGAGDPEKGRLLFRQQACINCHSFANGQQPRGPHLVDITKRYKREELIESIVQPSRRIAQGFDTWAIAMQSGQVHTGFIVLESAETVTLRDTTGIARDLIQDEIEDRVRQEISVMPAGVVGNLTPQQLADLLAWLETLH
ncbi:MAG: HEAT repeat domain-containing protein, partial [Planctomyces sp.]